MSRHRRLPVEDSACSASPRLICRPDVMKMAITMYVCRLVCAAAAPTSGISTPSPSPVDSAIGRKFVTIPSASFCHAVGCGVACGRGSAAAAAAALALSSSLLGNRASRASAELERLPGELPWLLPDSSSSSPA
eukprot:329520-Chlamydomonas_euryale.AAC.1